MPCSGGKVWFSPVAPDLPPLTELIRARSLHGLKPAQAACEPGRENIVLADSLGRTSLTIIVKEGENVPYGPVFPKRNTAKVRNKTQLSEKRAT